jgi:hypothetical protein
MQLIQLHLANISYEAFLTRLYLNAIIANTSLDALLTYTHLAAFNLQTCL